MEIARLQDSFSHRAVLSLPVSALPCHQRLAAPPGLLGPVGPPDGGRRGPTWGCCCSSPASSLDPFRQADLLQLPSPRDGRGAPSGPRAGLAASDRPRPGHR